MGYKFGILLALFAGGLVTVAKPQQQANYELAEKFNAFDLGGNFPEIAWPFIRMRLMVQIISGLIFRQQTGNSIIM